MSRPISIKYLTSVYNNSVDAFPSECGLCHKNVDPRFIGGSFVRGDNKSANLEAVFQCTNQECNSLIIGYYHNDGGIYRLDKHAPIIPTNKNFNEEIDLVSSNFVEIYNQSLFAEQSGLTLISGIGYRKSLEYLIKDYLVFLNENEEEAILKLPLGQCISNLDNHNIKEMAKRATWLGNDEAHYVRKWEDKDINDLKKLIEVTVYFISMDVSAKKYLEEMN